MYKENELYYKDYVVCFSFFLNKMLYKTTEAVRCGFKAKGNHF